MKYSEKKKLSATQDYCAGHAGLKRVAARHYVDVSSLRKWIAAYQAHGEEGLCTRTSRVRVAFFRGFSGTSNIALNLRVELWSGCGGKAFHSVRLRRSRTFAISISSQCGSGSMMTAVWPRDVHGLQLLPSECRNRRHQKSNRLRMKTAAARICCGSGAVAHGEQLSKKARRLRSSEEDVGHFARLMRSSCGRPGAGQGDSHPHASR